MDTGKRLRWSDIGKATDAGDYSVAGIVVSVNRSNIETWQENPSARFAIIRTDEMEGTFYTLGTWSV